MKALVGGVVSIFLMACCGLCGGFAVITAALIATSSPAVACGLATPLTDLDHFDTPSLGRINQTQIANAGIIVAVGIERKIPVRGQIIAVATAMQESWLLNLTYGDRDSLGLFQQRAGWGTEEERTDPRYASRKFYEALVKVSGWENMPLTVAAQKVQISAYPDAYAKHESGASALVSAISAGGVNCTNYTGWVKPLSSVVGSGFRTAERPNHQGVDLIVARNTPIKAAAAGIVVRARCNDPAHNCQREDPVNGTGCGWYVDIKHAPELSDPADPDSKVDVYTRYCHQLQQPYVTVGQEVVAGQVIGLSGSTGHSSGPHLHFEVHMGAEDSMQVDPVPFMKEHGAPLGQDPKADAFRPGNARFLFTGIPGVVQVIRPLFSIFAQVAALRTPVPERTIYTYSASQGADVPRLTSLHSGTGR